MLPFLWHHPPSLVLPDELPFVLHAVSFVFQSFGIIVVAATAAACLLGRKIAYILCRWGVSETAAAELQLHLANRSTATRGTGGRTRTTAGSANEDAKIEQPPRMTSNRSMLNSNDCINATTQQESLVEVRYCQP